MGKRDRRKPSECTQTGFGLFATLALALLAACASPGPPRPPSLNLPAAVSNLTAQRDGDEVRLRWTTGAKTTDGLDVRGPTIASICRRVPASPEQACVSVLHAPVPAGTSEAVDRPPAALLFGPIAVLEYRVEILNARGRSAGPSNIAYAASGPAPPPLQHLQGRASEEGAVLTWGMKVVDDEVELHRVTDSASKRAEKKPSPVAERNEEEDVTLRVPPGEGAVDRATKMGERYTYTAQRVRTVHIGERALEVRSLVSVPVQIEMRDVFSPRRPTGLEAVAGDGVVDLSWEPNTEPDLAGYLVQRQEDAFGKLLNTSPVPQPSFADKTAVPGRTYRYSVVAVDRAGNRSAASELLPVSLRPHVP